MKYGKPSLSKRILFLVSSFKKGGPVNQLYELLSSSVFKDHYNRITVISLSSLNVKDSRSADFASLGCNLKSFNNDSYDFYKLSKELLTFIKLNRFDIVVSQGIRSDISLSFIIKKIEAKCYCILHNYVGPDYKLTYGVAISRIMTILHLYALRRLNVISVSNSVADYILQTYKIKSIAIKNGVRSVNHSPSYRACDVVKLIYVGVVNKRKRVKELVDCYAALGLDKMSLTIAGSYKIKEINKAGKNIVYLGRRDDILSILSQHHIFVSFSAFEGLPMAALEALAMNIPCILSDIPPHREILALSAQFGCICDINDPDSLNQAIKYCLTINPLDIKRDFERFLSSEIMATAYFNLLMK